MDTQSLAEIMERDIARLRAARPHLASRIERAEHLLVTQLSVTNGSRPIKVRIASDGSRSYRVRSGSKLCRSYAVSPESWSCECPDHRKRSAACKHVMACWILARAFGEQAYRPAPVPGLEHVGAVAARVLVDTAVKAGEARRKESTSSLSSCRGHSPRRRWGNVSAACVGAPSRSRA